MSRLASSLSMPYGAYPERAHQRLTRLERIARGATGLLLARQRAGTASWRRFVRLVDREGAQLEGVGGEELVARAGALRRALRAEGFGDRVVARAFALVRHAADRVLGQRHFDTQLIGGKILLDGMVAEMETGEGKTLTATLPASTAALAGVPVHVVTVNDYLAARDAAWMGPVYRALGLTVGVVTQGMSGEDRRAAYAADVTYCSNKQLAFDYLRDRMALGSHSTRVHLRLERLYGGDARLKAMLLRGLHFGIVDEADSVLVDEARTPLIISGGGSASLERRHYDTALELAGGLEPGRDFLMEERERDVLLTDEGRMRLHERAEGLGGIWKGRQRRESLVCQALVAQRLLVRDKHYLVKDGKVQIIDEYTGRVMPDRSWERGLHQLVEAKEDLSVGAHQEPLARISYQRFFRRYLLLAGMTGTAREVAGELWAVYRLRVVSVPPNRPLRRRRYRSRMYPTEEAKWRAVVGRVARIRQTGRPILIGTRSVEASDTVSRLLTEAGLAHQVLNARQDQEEAEIIGRAGELGRITVATNMAGRGTDIKIGPDLARRGGLHVIATERHEARRIDRQLFGRCGRQGDPGSFEAITSLEDELVAMHGGAWRWLAARLGSPGRPIPRAVAAVVMRRAQARAERLHSRMRRDLLKADEQLESALAFTGRLE